MEPLLRQSRTRSTFDTVCCRKRQAGGRNPRSLNLHASETLIPSGNGTACADAAQPSLPGGASLWRVPPDENFTASARPLLSLLASSESIRVPPCTSRSRPEPLRTASPAPGLDRRSVQEHAGRVGSLPACLDARLALPVRPRAPTGIAHARWCGTARRCTGSLVATSRTGTCSGRFWLATIGCRALHGWP